jgi:uncharacterized protein YqcC (DUF446 family)
MGIFSFIILILTMLHINPPAYQAIRVHELSSKLEEIKQELRRLGLWRLPPPGWLSCYEEAVPEQMAPDFLTWLQFIYLPNKVHYKQLSPGHFMAPQAMAFLKDVQDKGTLLQLLIELDAII